MAATNQNREDPRRYTETTDTTGQRLAVDQDGNKFLLRADQIVYNGQVYNLGGF
ncbi:MAG: hypothetical protein WC702_04000 [Patescibacteria group bacterium]|jgi:hypothetical protein